MKRSLLTKLCVLATAVLLASCSPGVAPENSGTSSNTPPTSQSNPGSSDGSKPTESGTTESSAPVESVPGSEGSKGIPSSMPESIPTESIPGGSEEESRPMESTPGQSSSTENPGMERYQVNETYWTENITRLGFFGVNNNQLFTAVASQGDISMEVATIENDYGKLHVKAFENGKQYDYYYIPTNGGGYDYYYQNDDGNWAKTAIPVTMAAMVFQTFTSFIHPWAYSDFYFDANSLSYLRVDGLVDTINVGTEAEPETAKISHAAWKFEDSKMLSLDYDLTAGGSTGHMRISGYAYGQAEVRIPEIPADIPATKLELDHKTLELKVGENAKLTATIEPKNATNKNVQWASSNQQVAMVLDGLVYALGEGKATITATLGSLTATCEVEVKSNIEPVSNPFAGVTLTYKYSGEDGQGLALGYDADPTVYTKEWCEDFLSTITITFFDDGEQVDEESIEGGSFEMYSKAADGTLNYALFGTYMGYLGDYPFAEIDVQTYYNGKTGKYLHGDHITKLGQPVLLIGGVEFDSQKGLYEASSYIGTNMAAGTGVIAKGVVAFEKANDTPVHLQNLPEDPHDDNYEALVENKSFLFADAVDRVGGDDSMLDIVRETYRGSTLNLYENHAFDLIYKRFPAGNEYVDIDVVYQGTYTIDVTEDTDLLHGDTVYAVSFDVNVMYLDGIAKEGYTNIQAYFDASNNEFRLYEETTAAVSEGQTEKVSFFDRYVLQADVVPTPYVAPEAPDNWDAAGVEAALKSAGYTDMLPKMDGVKLTTIKSANAETGAIEIEAKIVYGDLTPYRNYISALTKANFTYDYDAAAGVVYYMSPNAEYKLALDFITSSFTVKFSIKKNVIEYPSDAIAEYLNQLEVTDPIIEFKTNSATSYQFDDQVLYVFLKAGTNTAGVIREFKSALAQKNYIVRSYLGNEYIVSEHSQIMFGLYEINESSMTAVVVAFYDASDFPSNVYPSNEVATYLEGVTDVVPSFANRNVEGYRTTLVNIMLGVEAITPLNTDVKAIVNGFVSDLIELGYSEDRTVTFQVDGSDVYYEHMYVSPNRQVAISFDVLDKDLAEQYSINFTEYTITLINLTPYQVRLDGDPVLPVAIRAEDYTEYWDVGDEYFFDGVVYADYADGHSEELAADQYTVNAEAVNMEVEGEYDVVITATFEGTVLSTTVHIYVFAPMPIEPEEIEYTFMCEDDAHWLEYDDPVYMVWAWGGYHGEGQWLEVSYNNGFFTFTGWEDAEGFELVRFSKNVSELEEFPVVWDETLDPYVVCQTGNLLRLPEGETEYKVFSFGLTPVYQHYQFINTNDWGILDSGAVFKVWAWGGEYGAGKWLDVDYSEVDGKVLFEFDGFDNAAGFKIVRFDPEVEDEEAFEFPVDWPQSLNEKVWNQSGNLLDIDDEFGGYLAFAFGD